MLRVFILGTVRKEEGKSPMPSTLPCAGLNQRREAGGRLCRTAPQTAAADGSEAQISFSSPSCFLQSPSPICQLQLSRLPPISRTFDFPLKHRVCWTRPRSQEHQDSRDGEGSAWKMRSHLEEPPCATTGIHANVGTRRKCQRRAPGVFN